MGTCGVSVNMKVRVYYDIKGSIISVLELLPPDEKRPPLEISTINPETKNFDIELSSDLAKLSLLEIHTKYKVNTLENPPRLIMIEVKPTATDKTSSG